MQNALFVFTAFYSGSIAPSIGISSTLSPGEVILVLTDVFRVSNCLKSCSQGNAVAFRADGESAE
jgi:hypothetical protein